MFKSLSSFFSNVENIPDASDNDLHLLSGLMMEAANIDGVIDQKEVNKISNVLIEVFQEEPRKVELELKKCLLKVNDNKSLHYYTSKINKSFDNEKKILLIQVLWEIILEDGEIHQFESNLVRRLSGLLYISDVQCGIAKNVALDKLKTQ